MFWLQENLILKQKMLKKCSTDQRFIQKRNANYKIGTLGVKVLVMSPSRAGLSHSSSWRIFSSAQLSTARGLFPMSSKKKSARKSENCLFWPLRFFFLIYLTFCTLITLFSAVFSGKYWFWLLNWLKFWFRYW